MRHLKGKKAAILAGEMYEDLELWYPYYRLREAGATVHKVGVAGGPKAVNSKHGYPASVDKTADKVKAADYDAVIIPGGYSPDHLRRCKKTVEFVADMYRRGKPVAAICHGGWMLCSAGVLKGKTVTGFFSIRDDMVNAGARWADREVVVDGNIITSRTPADLPAFMREIIRQLER